MPARYGRCREACGGRVEVGLSSDLEWQAAVELGLGDGDLADKALRAFTWAGEAIGRGIATLVTMLSPACVVIYAPVS